MYTMDEFIAHHGILGQRWGIRRYQNKDGSLTAAGRRHWDKLDRKTKAKIKDNMIRSSNVKVLQAHQKYLTPNELRKATERLAANKKVSEFKEEQIRRGMQKIVELGSQAKQVGEAVSNLTDSYNKIAKVINGVAGKNFPIIGEAKAARKFSFAELQKMDSKVLANLKGDELNNAKSAAKNYDEMMKSISNYKEDKKAVKEEKKAVKEEKKAVKEEKKAVKEEKKAEPTKFTTVDPGEYKKPAFSEKTEFSNKTTFSENKPTKFTVVDPGEYKKTSFYQENASKPISSFKEHYTSDDISSARNYVMSNFGNVSYNSIGDYKYSNPTFSAQYNKMTERNNNRNPYYVSHKDLEGEELFHYGVKGMKWDESKKKTDEESVVERQRKRLSSINRDNLKKGVVTSTFSDDAMDFAYNSANKLTNGELDKQMEKLSQKFNNYLNKKLDDAEKSLNKIGEKAENSIYNSMKDKDLADFYKRLIST